MDLTTCILQILRNLVTDNQFISIPDSKSLEMFNGKLLKINSHEIVLLEKLNLSEKVTAKKSDNNYKKENIEDFITLLKSKSARINHLGISYFCTNPTKEINEYRNLLHKTSFNIYEEFSEDPYQKWLFIGNKTDWQAPLFEIILNTLPTPAYTYWHPQFQIDIDTNLSFIDLEKITQKYFDSNFWQWKIDIPNYGVVLAMGLLGEIDRVKLTLCVGTNLRNTKYHRKKLLHKIT